MNKRDRHKQIERKMRGRDRKGQRQRQKKKAGKSNYCSSSSGFGESAVIRNRRIASLTLPSKQGGNSRLHFLPIFPAVVVAAAVAAAAAAVTAAAE